MKIHLLYFLVACLFATACSSTKSSTLDEMQVDTGMSIEQLKRSDYKILNEVEGVSNSTKVWFFFIPFSGKRPEKMRKQAYTDAVEKLDNCDGIIKPRYKEKRIVIPLIVINVVLRKTRAYGKGFKIKTDDELDSEG